MKIRAHHVWLYLPLALLVALGACVGWIVYQTRGPMDPPKVSFPTSEPVPAVAFSPDGRHLAAAVGKQIVIWDRTTREPWRTLAGHAAEVSSLAYSPDGTLLASGGTHEELILWDVERAAPRYTLQTGSPNSWSGAAVCFSPDGRILAGGGRLWSVSTGKEVRVYSAFGHEAVAFSPDGTLIASAIGDRVRLQDAISGAHLRDLPGPTRILSHTVNSIHFTPRGEAIIYSGDCFADDDVATVWERATGNERRIAAPALHHSDHGWVNCMAVSPDGRTLATGELTKARRSGFRIRLFDVPTGELIRVFWHRRVIVALAFSPDGAELAAGCGEDYGSGKNDTRGVCIWDVPAR